MKTRITSTIKSAGIAAVLLCTVANPARATTITVTNTNDSGPGSLRQALADANDGDTINFAVTGTIGLTSGELLVDKSITISGPGAGNLAVDGNAESRVFHIGSLGSTRTVIISDLAITNANVGAYGGGIYNDHAALTLNNCIVSDNSADYGGGIYNEPVLGSATLTLNNSTLSGNSANLEGGGIYNFGFGGTTTVTISNSSISGNSAPSGGGIRNYGQSGSATLVISNSTISGNSADLGNGGGISNASIGGGGGATL